ncbi:MAG TPA: LacI family DNA-binding transcriptional regulator [Jatrophihabitantaceae bacterium]
MGASLKDVALLAGVSMKTVSNVVNDYPFVTPETRAKVQRAIETLDYRPNLSARMLRGGRTGLVALAVPEIGAPYFAELAEVIVQQAKTHGWTVLIDQTLGDRDTERLVAEGIKSHLVDGLIVSPLTLTAEDIEQRRVTTPLVLLGERLTAAPVDHVTIDNVAGARAATEHLITLGRSRIAAIGNQPGQPGTAALRLKGYRQALRRAGLPYEKGLVAPAANYHRRDGAAAMLDLLLLEDEPDAVFCFNDTLALGAIRTLLSSGRRVPDDVAVIGWDDIDEGGFSTPSLSTIAPNKDQIAELALGLLGRRIADSGAEPREAVADFSLIARESTAGL